ncbi:hypothetical protein HanPI659440_Chr02g0083851 [Helianthus annuus]|uniref:Uncharacterized protein n=1 Tax=Helianthus annuus TaxID=4232 RepID=A0A251SZM1_HELAN|nr:uncharacterized protein LOC110894236 [Helianthus annuus]KAF5819129.1 hypothetical protein HanXRQr2_Chr02g0074101 [Helianthus annuus]KAJ0605333.1 hypothetical protein HanHA300_Chr02g0061851 [Helianthus annuus]KAJ0619348.1 hypothetical protein HanHA89_Chr02g0070351 [Helianthus annuus]KAJ0805927.1 hypothetical protein HanPI659440_Chr02g0083851 [Helianthus annuus]
MAFYMDEQQVWKCHKHPSRRRKTGICPKCLHDRLVTLCPDCAHPRPCACSPTSAEYPSSSSSSSTTSFSLFPFSRTGSRHDTNFSNNPEGDPALRKSRSVAISFLRSRSRHVGTGIGTGTGTGGCEVETAVNNNKGLPPKVTKGKNIFWSLFHKSKKCDVHNNGMDEDLSNCEDVTGKDDYSMMMRSRSVAVGGAGNRFTPASSKKGWYFPSPINAFRYSKSPRSAHVT